MRPSAFAGMFYEASEPALERQITDCFLSKLGPGALPSKTQKQKTVAAIAPHAGYVYSGACAAWSYKAIAESGLPDLFIIIGPNHSGRESGLSMETFETPLGLARTDQAFARELLLKGHLEQNDRIHRTEHSIEVQIPFLQFVFKENMEKVKILPIMIGSSKDLKEIALDIQETLIETKKKAVIIASSDFTHQGPNYGYVPFSSNKKEKIKGLDMGAIKKIHNLDPEGFLKYKQDTQATICGALPIALLLNTVKAKKVVLEQYYTSGDVVGDYNNSVSYASIVFKD
jgi:hypothetical protein